MKPQNSNYTNTCQKPLQSTAEAAGEGHAEPFFDVDRKRSLGRGLCESEGEFLSARIPSVNSSPPNAPRRKEVESGDRQAKDRKPAAWSGPETWSHLSYLCPSDPPFHPL